ncbi:MAG: permease, partial [Clostridia bacterium]|nr:permease [Clostridia bacterium]
MELFKIGSFSLSISGVAFLIFSILAIAAIGYLLGKVTIKGVNLGTAGVFLIALLFGCLFYGPLNDQLAVEGVKYTTNALKVVENLGLMLFVTSVGFIAGPKFFGDLKRNFKTYILLGLIIICSGALICAGCIVIAKMTMDVPAEELNAVMTGLFSGALTSTPAFSAAKEAIGKDYESFVAVGNGIAYIFGVIGVVLFVQLIPKFTKADMAVERAKLSGGDGNAEDPVERNGSKMLINIDSFGIAPFAIAAIVGLLIGSIKYGSFSLTTT